MSIPCTICRHKQRAEIDEALVRGEPVRLIAVQYGAGPSALQRHKRHIAAEIAKYARAEARRASVAIRRAVEVKTLAADDLLARAQDLHDRAVALLGRAEEQGKTRDALLAIREASGTLRLLGEVLGRLQSAAQVTVILAESPEWLTLQAKIMAVLDRHPKAREDMLRALGGGGMTAVVDVPARPAGHEAASTALVGPVGADDVRNGAGL